jgi:hypothetical protein
MLTQDTAGLSIGWQPKGTWTVVVEDGKQPPAAVSVTPSSGNGASQTFSLVYSSPKGYGDLPWAQVNINSTLSPTRACYLHYDRGSNRVWLLNDDASAFLGPAILGTSGALTNSQCSVNAAASSATASGNTLTVNLALGFWSAFAGAKTIYMLTQDTAGLSIGWQPKGTWTVP